jgi:peptidoglycan/LPS O-acetylase OafA/YrhL
MPELRRWLRAPPDSSERRVASWSVACAAPGVHETSTHLIHARTTETVGGTDQGSPYRGTVSAATPSRHIPSLDGIRAISFILVFVTHAGLEGFVSADFGVTTFFFLSGFLITTLMRSEFEKNGSVNIRHFWLRRALRILPPLYLVIPSATLAILVLYPPGTVRGSYVVAQLLFFANYWGLGDPSQPPETGPGVVWSLAVEEHFYLLFPWLFIAMQKWRMSWPAQAWLLWGMCVLILAWRFVLVLGLHANGARIYLCTDTRLDSILFGCALAVWNNPVLDKPTSSPNLWKYLLLPAAVAALSLCFAFQGRVFRDTWYLSAQGIALTVLFISAVRFRTWPVFSLLNVRPVTFIGTLSYSLYLVHLVFLKAIERLWPHYQVASRALIALTLSMIVAWTIYVVIERPCARLRRNLTDQ